MPRRPHIVCIRLSGSAEDVTFWLNLLNDIATLAAVSKPPQHSQGYVTAYAIVSRTDPLKGGPR
jgi:hypothetical protein